MLKRQLFEGSHYTVDEEYNEKDAKYRDPPTNIHAKFTIMDIQLNEVYLYILIKELGIIAIDRTVHELVYDRCVFFELGRKFNIYENNLIVVKQDNAGYTLLEFNHYILDD